MVRAIRLGSIGLRLGLGLRFGVRVSVRVRLGVTIGGDDLDCEVACVHEAIRVQTDLGNHRVVRHHHRHRTKQYLHMSRSGLD